MTQENPNEFQDGAPGEYPEEAQNPRQRPGLRPTDQPSGEVRVPDDTPDVRTMTTDERMREDPKRRDLMTPPDDGTAPDAVEDEAKRR